MMRLGSDERGFSLLEVMVAFAITTLALGILSQIFGQGSRNLDLSNDYTRAVAIAENLLAEYGRPQSTEIDTQSDTQGDFQWRVEIAPYVPTTRSEDAGFSEARIRDDIHLVRITVEVGWERYGNSRKVALESLRLVTGDDNAS